MKIFDSSESRQLKKNMMLLTLLWTVIMASSFIWNNIDRRKELYQNYTQMARVALNKDIMYRVWCSMHGGVYVPVTEQTPPNPYLVNVMERDIVTPSGRQFTLMNPAYMTRQVYEVNKDRNEIYTHITSTKPIRPQNSPDEWESNALKSFEEDKTGKPEKKNGPEEKEILAIQDMNGKKFMRLISPLYVEESCMKCHSVQGYKTGEIRGGISVAVPLESLKITLDKNDLFLILRYLCMWFFGIGGIFFTWVNIHRQIKKRKHAEEELIKAKEVAEAATRAKSAFLANMSHEIRTPMNAVLGMNRLALESASDPKQRRYLETAQYSAESLLALINDILDFSKIEAGQIDLDEAPFDLEHVLKAVRQTFSVQIEEKSLELKYHLPAGLHTALLGDEYRLRQILTNLIGNAVKFTETGGIRIEVEEVSHDGTYVVIQFCVKDTGIGLPAELYEHIFNQFTQADSSVTRKFGGTGLGLAICKKLTELLGGKIWVESEPGNGSNFYFTARYSKCDPNLVQNKFPDTSEKVFLPPLDILLVEDNRFNRELALVVLENKGHTVVCAENGVVALEKLTSDNYDVILMDVQMPELDGIETTMLIRACENRDDISSESHQTLLLRVQNNMRGMRTPIIAMTAHAMADDRRKCIESGMDDYVTKPFQVEDVFQAIARVTGKSLLHKVGIDSTYKEEKRKFSTAIFQEAKIQEQKTKQHVMIVDDIPYNIQFMVAILADTYEVSIATNGWDALELAHSDNPPDIILLDIMMPEMDGYEVCVQLKSSKRTQHIPVIFITAKDDTNDQAKGLNIGAVDYISKPVSLPIVRARIAIHLALSDQNRMLEEKVRQRTMELNDTQDVTIRSLAILAEYRDNETGGHIVRTQQYVRILAEKLKNHPRFSDTIGSDEMIELLFKSAPLHDIGKVAIKDNILLKPGRLTDEEFAEIKRHTIYGAEALEKAQSSINEGTHSSFLSTAREIALTHHEKYDSSGYPAGLKGDEIPISGRLMAIADIYDALVSKRVYKPPFSHKKAYSIITEGDGRVEPSHFDPDVLDAFKETTDSFREVAIKFADSEEERNALMADNN